MSTVWPLVPIEFVADLGIFMVDNYEVKDRDLAFTAEVERHFTSGGAPGATFMPDITSVSLRTVTRKDDEGHAIESPLVGSVMVKFTDVTIEEAQEYAATFTSALPFVKNLHTVVVTQEYLDKRRADKAADDAKAKAYINARRKGLKDAADKAASEKAAADDDLGMFSGMV